ncbi:MAG: substrate-binding domain-containing protein, partial [Micromonosporaceae bacterium]|nr:substrate-binding domain-containing protein [Micromonosporaceae bacterium]
AGSRVDDPDLLGRLRAELDAFESAGGRAVAISQDKLGTDTVVVENRAGAMSLAEALADLGHRRFAVLAGPPDLLTARDRLTGFREGLERAGAQVRAEHVVHGDFTRDGGYAAMARLLDRRDDVTCVFAVNDVMAVGAMAVMRDRGMTLPEAMAIAGFDDISTLRDVTPSLTTVRLPLERLGSTAVELMTQPLAETPRVRRLKGEVVLRASTPPTR